MNTTIPAPAAANCYFIAVPDPAAASRLARLITDRDAGASVQLAPGLAELYNLLPTAPDRTVVLIELVWNGEHATDILLSLLYNYPQLAWLIVSEADPAAILPPYFPIPHVQGLDRAEEILAASAALTEDLRGTQLGSYQIQQFAGQSYLGRAYQAHQAAINRLAHLTVLPADATAAARAEFAQIAAARARNIFPQIYSIYEESAAAGRPFIAEEPVTAPSLLQYSLQHAAFDSRLVANLLATCARTLAHLRAGQIPYQPIHGSHITVSPDGVIRLANTALPPGAPLPEPGAELRALAGIVRGVIQPGQPVDPRLLQILHRMTDGQADYDTVSSAAETVSLALAPVKQVAERQSAIKAKQEISKAKKHSLLVTYLSAGSIALLLIFVIIQVILMFIEVPGRDLGDQVRIPAGTVEFNTPAGKQTAQLAEFYMDKYEVTIGQYEKFLKAMTAEQQRDPDAYKKYLPPGVTIHRDNFTPHDWASIRKTLRRGLLQPAYGGNRVTRDTPVFNVDYPDAYAYAKWAGKRLPTELEWQRAAGGDGNWPYPWGQDYQADYRPEMAVCSAVRPDAKPLQKLRYPGPQIVDKFTRDQSPFGIIGMAGNVSEWVALSPELGPLPAKYQADFYPMQGANFSSPQLIPSTYHRRPQLLLPDDTVQIGLGFRCASDRPVKR
ncbi:MAG: formylglycine-generating enzyme family protein [Verrucomicrobiales bacterium]|jgi:formylglycine-generating enzyme required for sulfatase activity|nr:formylglycine-generating enzyme family protein [Verrucomicrobiales bacterium]